MKKIFFEAVISLITVLCVSVPLHFLKRTMLSVGIYTKKDPHK